MSGKGNIITIKVKEISVVDRFNQLFQKSKKIKEEEGGQFDREGFLILLLDLYETKMAEMLTSTLRKTYENLRRG